MTSLELELMDFDLLAVVEEAADELTDLAQDKGLELLVDCHADVPAHVRGDPVRIRQVLVGLTRNALVATEAGEVVIRVRLVETEQEGDGSVLCRFEVTDTAGKPDGDAREELTSASRPTGPPAGPGASSLGNCRQHVESMGGDLTVELLPDGGTTWFTLSLQVQRQPTGPLGHREFLPLKGIRVLVVDDNRSSQRILGEQLGTWGMHVVTADDGFSALDQLLAAVAMDEPYHLVMIDQEMPRMDGLKLAGSIAADSALAAARLVLLTSDKIIGADRPGMAALSARLSKPLHQSSLHQRLVQVLTPLPDMQTTIYNPRPLITRVRGRVLIVEDDDISQLVTRGMLAHLGYGSDISVNGREALEAMEHTEYEAVLMDCDMPVMDGFAATAEIRRREGQTRHVAVIALTAHATPEVRQRCLAAGMDDFLAKPVQSADLDAVMARWFGTVSASDSSH